MGTTARKRKAVWDRLRDKQEGGAPSADVCDRRHRDEMLCHC